MWAVVEGLRNPEVIFSICGLHISLDAEVCEGVVGSVAVGFSAGHSVAVLFE